jgi:hypothetical protein
MIGEDLRGALLMICEMARLQNEYIAKHHARLVVLRKAIADSYPDPKAAEEHLRKLEADAEEIVLSGQGFPESDALLALLKAGKKLDALDS